MVFLKEALGSDEDRGEWFEYTDDGKLVRSAKAAEGVVRLRIRAVPDSELRRIHRRHYGTRQELRHEKGSSFSQWEAEKGQAMAVDKAVYALTEAQGFSLEVAAENATTYTQLLGRPVTAGSVLVLDTQLTQQVKEHVLEQFDRLVSDINDASDEQKKLGVKAEAELKS